MQKKMLRKKDIRGSYTCEFCQTLLFERSRAFERCARYNAQTHVKSGHAYSAVRLINYIIDNRKWVMEKQSKHFLFRFCPVCGFDYIENKEFDGKKYKTLMNINRVMKYKENEDA